MQKDKFEDAKEVIRSRKLKIDRQYNGHKKWDKTHQWSTKHQIESGTGGVQESKNVK